MHPRPAPPATSHLAPALREPYHEYGGWTAPRKQPSPTAHRRDLAQPLIVPRRGPASIERDGSDQDDETPSGIGRRRSLTTPFQAQVLRAFISITRFPATALRDEIGDTIGLSGRQVQVWFQNQRQKARKLFPSIDLDNEVFPLKALLASQPLASSSYTTLTQKAIPHVLALNEEITAALHDAGMSSTSQHLTEQSRKVIARYCGPTGGAGTRAERSFVSSPTPASASSKFAADRSRMPPPVAPVPRISPTSADSKLRFSHYQARPDAAGPSQSSSSMSPQSGSSSHRRERSPSPPLQLSAQLDPDLLLPPLREENIREALSLPADFRPLELETDPPSPGSQHGMPHPAMEPPRLAHVRTPPLPREAALPALSVLLHPPHRREAFVPEPLQTIPRQALQRERLGTPDWWAHGPVDDAALDPELVDSLRRMGVLGNRRRPFQPYPRGPRERDTRRWLWGSELRPRRGELQQEPACWEWEWEVPRVEVPEIVARRRSRRARLVGADAGDEHGLFSWLVTGRYSGRPFLPANDDPSPREGTLCVRDVNGQWATPYPPPPC